MRKQECIALPNLFSISIWMVQMWTRMLSNHNSEILCCLSRFTHGNTSHEAQIMLVPLIRRIHTKPKDFKGNYDSTFVSVEWFDMYILDTQ